jgi:hypothetical protein
VQQLEPQLALQQVSQQQNWLHFELAQLAAHFFA